MKIHHNIENLKIENPIVTVGIFDGVHKGHKYILNTLTEISKLLHGEPVIVTLWPHPRHVLNHDPSETRLITTLDEKIEILEGFGIHHLIILDFTKEFSRLSSSDFIEKILVGKIGIRHLVVGYNHRFGRDREGDIKRLKEYAVQFGFTVEQLQPYLRGNRKISSSMIRKAILQGDIKLTNELLGHRFFIRGKVIGGSRVGRSIGFPTANVKAEHSLKLLPKDGVYAVEVLINNVWYKGMLNIGIRPTVSDNPEHKTIEVHIIDFEKDIYDREIRIDLVKRIRDEMKFSSVDLLKEQLIRDKEVVLNILHNQDREDQA